MEKEQKRNETKEKKLLTEQQRQQRKKMLVYPLMVLLLAGCMWLIFASSQENKEKEQQGQGFNTDVPLPKGSKIIGDKAKAYEQLELEKRRKERRGMVDDLFSFWNNGNGDESDTISDDYRLTRTETSEDKSDEERQVGIRTSAVAYERLNTPLDTFYEPPKEDTEKEEPRERIDKLEAMLIAQEGKPSTMEEQVTLLEKSYELMARYQNRGNSTGQATRPKEEIVAPETNGKGMKTELMSDVWRMVVSALSQPMTDSAFTADCSGERNYSFHTAVDTAEVQERNTIAVCVQGDQTVTDGQTVKLRLLELMRASGRAILRNTPLVGVARLQGERLSISVTSPEHGGSIIPVELEVHDSDGQAGIFISGLMEIDAAKEIGANMGNSFGSSINTSIDAGAQLVFGLGRGAIQGISQYISKRMRTVKVHLKSGYRVLLYQEEEWQPINIKVKRRGTTNQL